MRLALLQHACTDDLATNLAKAEDLARRAVRDERAEFLVTQELFGSLYFPVKLDEQAFDIAEPIPGPTTQHFSQLAAELHVPIAVSLYEKARAGVYFNTLVIVDASGTITQRYRKMHIPHDPGFEEKYYFTPGDQGFKVASVRDMQVGMLVCWDQWFPEAARANVLQGAQLLIYPTAIGGLAGEDDSYHADQHDAWRTVQRGHAIANGVYVAACNRVGVEAGTKYWGGSFICDPFGRIVAEAGDEEGVLCADIDVTLVEATRRGWPFLRDRRIDAYDGLQQR